MTRGPCASRGCGHAGCACLERLYAEPAEPPPGVLGPADIVAFDALCGVARKHRVASLRVGRVTVHFAPELAPVPRVAGESVESQRERFLKQSPDQIEAHMMREKYGS